MQVADSTPYIEAYLAKNSIKVIETGVSGIEQHHNQFLEDAFDTETTNFYRILS